MKLIIFRKNGASLELLNIHLFLKIVYQKVFFGDEEKKLIFLIWRRILDIF